MSLPELQHRLLQWYRQHGRHDLPWRTVADAYPIYISEVMLQQTQVSTVLERYYFPFLARFPTLEALADADEQDVLLAWQGLGYYSRARNLYRAAKQARSGLKPDVLWLQSLPGIGKNTAHAVAAFGFRLPVPVMEANVKRVLCRLFALATPTANQLWEQAERFLNHAEPFDHNQAMMDLGAMVCTPKRPHCAACPLAADCQGKHAPEHFPQPKAKASVPIRKQTLLIIQRPTDGKVLLIKRQQRFLGGLYGFPEWPVDTPPPNWLAALAPTVEAWKPLGAIRHTYSHFTLEGSVFHAPLTSDAFLPNDATWEAPCNVTVPLSRADEKALALLDT